MKHIAAYMLCVLGGKKNPEVADVVAILKSVDAKYEEEKIKQLCAELKDKNLEELIEEGKKKMSTVAVAAAPAAAAAAPAAAAEEKKEEKKEEEKKEEEEEEEGDFGLDLFA